MRQKSENGVELTRLKGLLGIAESDVSKDCSLQFIVDDVAETILNYCNLKDLPAGLTNTVYRMAIDLYRHERPGETEVPMTVTSISEGDTSTSFAGVTDTLTESILKNYRGQLNRYRKLGE